VLFILAFTTYDKLAEETGEGRLEDKKGGSPIPWNKLRPEEETSFGDWLPLTE